MIEKIYKGMGSVSEWVAKVAIWLLAILIVSIVYDVVMRYLFNAPTTWSFVLSYMLGAAFSALGQARGDSIGSNVRVDIFYTRFSARGKQIIDLVFTIIFFFPLYGFLAYYFAQLTQEAIRTHQTALESTWYPIIWPYMIVVTFGLGLLFVQGIATFLKNLMSLVKGGKEPW